MGYDIMRFKNKEINQEFICGICHDVLENPLVIDPCDHIFCSECLHQWIAQQESCPVDRNKISISNLHKPFRSFLNLINGMEINCEFFSNGCSIFTKVEDLKFHIDNCKFNPNKNILCDCGKNIHEDSFIDHQIFCVDYLRKQLKSAFDIISTMNIKLNELEETINEAKKEVSISSEWKKYPEIRAFNTNISDVKAKRLIEILTDLWDRKNFDNNALSENLCVEFGGNWTVLIGKEIISNNKNFEKYFFFKIGEIQIFISMYLIPNEDVLIVDKLLKVLDKGLDKNIWNEDMTNSWHLLYNLTDGSRDMSERLLDKNIMNYFIQSYNLKIKEDSDLDGCMVGLFANISEFSELRYRLMHEKFLSIIVELLSKQDQVLCFVSAQLIANILSEGLDFYEQHIRHDPDLNKEIVLDKLMSKINEWILKENITLCLRFSSFKPFNHLLQYKKGIPQEVHYFALWTLAYLILKNGKIYCHLLEEDGCVQVLEDLIKQSELYENVRKLAKLILLQNRVLRKQKQVE